MHTGTKANERRALTVLRALTLIAMLVALYAAFVYAPIDKDTGVIQKIFYFHVPSAWIAYLAFLVVFVASVLYLRKRERKWDILAHSSAELGVIFSSIVLITGPIWAKPTWGTWWTWDPRLTTTLILWLIYVAYLMLRAYADEGAGRARYAAVLGILGFINVPIVHMSVRWWRGIHGTVLRAPGGGLPASMLYALLSCLAAFTILYVYLLLQRVALELMADELKAIKREVKEMMS